MVVGHALHNDFRALKYVHPRSQTRDTTYVPNLLSQRGLHTRARVSLKELALQLLHKKIQVRVRVWGAGGKQDSPPYRGAPGWVVGLRLQLPIIPTQSRPRVCMCTQPWASLCSPLPGVHLFQDPLSGLSPSSRRGACLCNQGWSLSQGSS